MSDLTWNKFIDLIQKEENDLKQQAIKMLPKLLNEKNVEKFLNDITPFLLNIIDEEDDVIIQEVLSNIPSIILYIKGISSSKNNTSLNKNIEKLIPYIELGLLSYNVSLREESAKSYKLILKECMGSSSSLNNNTSKDKESNKEFEAYDLVLKLSNSISQKSRIAFLTIVPIVYKYLNSTQKSRVSSFLKQFSFEGTEYVKKILAVSLKEISLFISEDILTTIIQNLLESTNESVRIPIMSCIANLKYHPNLNLLQNLVQQTITSVAKDEAWRVRYTLASNISDILSFSIISSNIRKDLIKFYCNLINDNEMEIRVLCFKNVSKILEKVKDDEDNVSNIIIAVEKQALNETDIDVKEVIAENVISLVKFLSKNIIKNIIIPIINYLLKDSNNEINKSSFNKPTREVTSSSSKDLINKLDTLNKSPSPEKRKLPNSTSNSPGINSNKSKDKKFNSGNLEKNRLNLNKSEGNSLVYDNSGECNRNLSVQIKLIKNIPYLVKYYPSLDYEIEVINNLNSIYNNGMWKTKSLLINTLQDLIGSNYFSKNTISNEILNLLTKAMQDNVYYVREASIKCLTDVLVKYQDDPNIENKIFQFLEKLKLSTSTFHQRNSYSLLLLSIVKNKNSSEALINNFLLPIAIENIATDRVGSIRCIGAQIILNIININKKFYSTKVKICLSTLAKDNDPDVKALIQKSL